MKKFSFQLLVLLSISAFSQTIHNINNPSELKNLTLNAGDTVVLADGIYSSDERIKFSPTTGTADNPITFKAATPGGVKFTGGLQMSIGGDYVIVDGFYWQGGYGASNFIEFRDGSDYANYSTIQNCAIDGLAISPDDKADNGTTSITKHRWIVLYGTYNSVINCSFMNKESAGALILVELAYNASPNGTTNTSCIAVGHTISNNYFYKYAKIDPTLSNSGDSETIRIGSSENQNVNSNTIVTNNYFVESDGENEIITNKSKNNQFINNTFRRCRGSLVLRHGSNALVNGNYFLGENIDGTGGIRITDSNHIITNNYIQDCITSRTSSNTRTELGEKKHWIPEEGGKLTATLKVQHVSTTGHADISSSYAVVVGQIHSGEGHENEPLKIYYKKFPGHTKGSVFWNYEINTLGDNSGRWDFSTAVWGYDFSVVGTDATTEPEEPKDGIELGEEFTYEVNVYKGMMYLTFTSENHPTVKFAKNLLKSDFSTKADIPQQVIKRYATKRIVSEERPNAYAGEINYFKQGAYNQANGKSTKSEIYNGDISKQYQNGSYAEVWFKGATVGESTNPNQ
jgi:hypothetical protein